MTGETVRLQTSMTEAAEEAAASLRALSNPSRLLILCMLIEKDHCVGEIERALGLGQAYVSQQLARLRAEGIVSARREGRAVRYRITDARIVPVIEVLHRQYCTPGDAEDGQLSPDAA